MPGNVIDRPVVGFPFRPTWVGAGDLGVEAAGYRVACAGEGGNTDLMDRTFVGVAALLSPGFP